MEPRDSRDERCAEVRQPARAELAIRVDVPAEGEFEPGDVQKQ
jgi:hypothetical protein